jgi:hypothetical protein
MAAFLNALLASSLVSCIPSGSQDTNEPEEPRFKKYFTMVFENTDFKVAMETPFLKELSTQGRLLSNMHGYL